MKTISMILMCSIGLALSAGAYAANKPCGTGYILVRGVLCCPKGATLKPLKRGGGYQVSGVPLSSCFVPPISYK